MSTDHMPPANPFETQDGIFIHHVPEREMHATLLGKRKIEVPRGHVAVVMREGLVHEVLPSGVQVALGFWERLLGESGKKSFFVVSLRPVGLLSRPVVVQQGSGRSVAFQALVQLTVPVSNPERLGDLVERVIDSQEFIDISTVRANLAPHVDQAVKASLVHDAQGQVDLSASERAIRERLAAQLVPYGFSVTVSLSSGEQRTEVNVRLGEGPSPGLKHCVQCAALLQETKKFCSRCGTHQPISTHPSTSAALHDLAQAATARPCESCGTSLPLSKKFCVACGHRQAEPPAAPASDAGIPGGQARADDKAFTADDEPVAVDLSLLVEGYPGRGDEEPIQRALQAALRAGLRQVTSAQLGTREGLLAFEDSIRGDLERAVASVGGRLLHIGVLDVRQKTGEWLTQARAELERARKEADLDRDWLERDAEEAEILALQYEVAMRRVQVENDHSLAQHRAALQARFERDEATLADRERRAALEERGVDQDIADAQRDARRDIATDAATREAARARRAQDQGDRLQELADERTYEGARREGEREALAHEQALEREVAAHDLGLRAQARRAQASDDSFASRLQADDDLYARRNQQALADEVAERELERKHKDADLAHARALDAEERRQQQRMAELKEMAQLEAAMDAREKDHELRMRQELKGLSVDEMLAIQASGAQGGGVTAALAKKFEADAGAEAARARAEEIDRSRERESAAQDRMMSMMQQLMTQNQSFAASVLQQQAEVTQAALGNARVASDRERDSLRAGTQQAVSMSERAMGAMAQVAAQAASPPVVTAPVGMPAVATPAQVTPPAPAGAKGAAADGPWRCGACRAFNDPADAACSECGAARA